MEVELTLDASGNWEHGVNQSDFKCNGMTAQNTFQLQKRAHSNCYCSSSQGTSWNSHKVIARYDNESIVTVLNSCYSKEPHVMNIM